MSDRELHVTLYDDGRVAVDVLGFPVGVVGRVLEVLTGETPTAIAVSDVPLVAKSESVKPTKRQPAVAAAHQCDECDRSFENPHGLTVHRARSHKTPIVAEAASAAAEPAGREWRLRCEDCDYTADAEDLKSIRQHTMTVHEGRLPSSVERTPSVA